MKSLLSQSSGANTRNAFGKVILQPCPCGKTSVGKSLATKAAPPTPSEHVGSLLCSSVIADAPSDINGRTGPNCGSFFTCSSDKRRNLPAERSSSQAGIFSCPLIQGMQAEKFLGKSIRLEASDLACAGISGFLDKFSFIQFSRIFPNILIIN